MSPLLQKHTAITAAMTATLFMSACGAKKDVIAPPPAGTEQSQSPAPADSQNTQPQQGTSTPKVGGESNFSSPTPIPMPRGMESERGGDSAPPVANNRPAPPLNSNNISPDYKSDDYTNVGRDFSKRLTGAITSDGYEYTSTSTDQILEFLRTRNEGADEYSRQANLAAAGSVLHSRLSFESFSGSALITLKIQEFGEVKVYNLVGGASSGPSNSLRLVRFANGEKTTGTRDMVGTLKCLDFDGGCENMFARIKIGTSPEAAIVNIIFRQSAADLYFQMPGEYSTNPEYAILRELMWNTIQGNDSINKVKASRMHSWEVVNGRSGVMLGLKAFNNELLAFAGPLLSPEGGTSVNVPLKRIAEDNESSLDLFNSNNVKLQYANWICDARMIANNGLGQVRVLLKMRQRGIGGSEQVAITFMRKVKPLIELTNENLK